MSFTYNDLEYTMICTEDTMTLQCMDYNTLTVYTGWIDPRRISWIGSNSMLERLLLDAASKEHRGCKLIVNRSMSGSIELNLSVDIYVSLGQLRVLLTPSAEQSASRAVELQIGRLNKRIVEYGCRADRILTIILVLNVGFIFGVGLAAAWANR